MSSNIDITPSPRVLRMLGEIDFKAWQCLCEIVDNSIDSFTSDFGSSTAAKQPTITIKLPSTSASNLKATDVLEIKDNGKGMTIEELEKSIKAGFTANNPVDKMGLFGMGFNISTARLGSRTEVITSTIDSEDFLKVTIDFHELETAGKFLAPVERIPKKADEKFSHGTTIRITKLRTTHIQPLYRKKVITDKLGKIYGRILIQKGIHLSYSGSPCKPFRHCVWSPMRSGQNKDGPVPAVIEIDHLIDEKKYCQSCWVWLSEVDNCCPSCGDSSLLSKRERRVKGWIGIQRYFDDNHYGIDLIRNGRVIRELDKSFFYWENIENQEPEIEYPIDGHERKGRIVGELEIDFVKVTHQKDAFDITSVDWRDVVLVVRGDAPIRPQIAKSKGFVENVSPIAKLFSAFRTAKAGVKNLVPQRSNGSAMITDSLIDELVRKFNDGEDGYQNDEKWWLLLNQAKPNPPVRPPITGPFVFPPPSSPPDTGPTGGNPFLIPDPDPESVEENGLKINEVPTVLNPTAPAELNVIEPDLELSRVYSLDLFKNISIRVVAEKRISGTNDQGFTVSLRGSELQFSYWPSSSIFQKSLLRPADFLINELGYHLHTISQNELSKVPLSVVELAIRDKYFPELNPRIEELQRQIGLLIEEVTEQVKNGVQNLENFSIEYIPNNLLKDVRLKLAKNEYLSEEQIDLAIVKGEFFNYAQFELVVSIARIYPELIFDGTFLIPKWDLERSDSVVNESLSRDLENIFTDIVWFTENSGNSSSSMWRGRVRRVMGSLEIFNGWRA